MLVSQQRAKLKSPTKTSLLVNARFPFHFTHMYLNWWIKLYVSRQNGKRVKYCVGVVASCLVDWSGWWTNQSKRVIETLTTEGHHFLDRTPLCLKKRKCIQSLMQITSLNARDVIATAEIRTVFTSFACICCANIAVQLKFKPTNMQCKWWLVN